MMAVPCPCRSASPPDPERTKCAFPTPEELVVPAILSKASTPVRPATVQLQVALPYTFWEPSGCVTTRSCSVKGPVISPVSTPAGKDSVTNVLPSAERGPAYDGSMRPGRNRPQPPPRRRTWPSRPLPAAGAHDLPAHRRPGRPARAVSPSVTAGQLVLLTGPTPDADSALSADRHGPPAPAARLLPAVGPAGTQGRPTAPGRRCGPRRMTAMSRPAGC